MCVSTHDFFRKRIFSSFILIGFLFPIGTYYITIVNSINIVVYFFTNTLKGKNNKSLTVLKMSGWTVLVINYNIIVIIMCF